MNKKFGIGVLTWALIAVSAAYATPTMKPLEPDAVAVSATAETKDSVTLSISRKTIGGTDIISPTSFKVEADSTVWTVLQKALDEKDMDYEYTYSKASNDLYVTSIDGVKTGANGPMSGWMFTVNGKFLQDSANKVKVVEGDIIEWKYTKDGGKDIGA